jgi:uncharacterized lipoprotein YajG
MRTTAILALAAALLAGCAAPQETSSATSSQQAPRCSAEEPVTGSNIGRRAPCKPAS